MCPNATSPTIAMTPVTEPAGPVATSRPARNPQTIKKATSSGAWFTATEPITVETLIASVAADHRARATRPYLADATRVTPTSSAPSPHRARRAVALPRVADDHHRADDEPRPRPRCAISTVPRDRRPGRLSAMALSCLSSRRGYLEHAPVLRARAGGLDGRARCEEPLPLCRLAVDARVHLVEQRFPVGEREVLGEVAVGLLPRRAVERHVERDQPSALGVVRATGGGGRLGRLGAGPTVGRGVRLDRLAVLLDLGLGGGTRVDRLPSATGSAVTS